MVGDAFAVLYGRLPRSVLAGLVPLYQGPKLLVPVAVVAECVGRFLHSQQHGLFIVCKRLVCLASAARRRARTLPMSNAFQEIAGEALQAREARLPICEPRAAVNPRNPVRLTRGNKSAVAAPSSAVLAASCRSAERMSGLRRSNSLGSPIRITVSIAGNRRGDRSTAS